MFRRLPQHSFSHWSLDWEGVAAGTSQKTCLASPGGRILIFGQALRRTERFGRRHGSVGVCCRRAALFIGARPVAWNGGSIPGVRNRIFLFYAHKTNERWKKVRRTDWSGRERTSESKRFGRLYIAIETNIQIKKQTVGQIFIGIITRTCGWFDAETEKYIIQPVGWIKKLVKWQMKGCAYFWFLVT